MAVSLTCETYIDAAAQGREITREDITCRIIYCSTSESFSFFDGHLILIFFFYSQPWRMGSCLSPASPVQEGVSQVCQEVYSVRC